jgi:Na+/H+ antiporter NhaA
MSGDEGSVGAQTVHPTPIADQRQWSGQSENPIALFVRTETAGALALLVAAVSAVVWANIDYGSYQRVWDSVLSIRLGRFNISMSLTAWVNSGLMTFFFFVVGLEARREFDIGDLRDRRRIVAPFLAGLGGMAVATMIFVIANIGRASESGWGVAISTDTAFALGVLALIRPPFPERSRVFLLTVVIVDDIVALVVVATVYSGHVSWVPLGVAAGLVATMTVLVVQRVRRGTIYLLLAIPAWVALSKSGVDPVVLGLAMGLLTYAAPAARPDLERATQLFRGFREQPTPELARAVRRGVSVAVPPNERLEGLFHPWASLLIVPLFALANSGIVLDRTFLVHTLTSPITLGLILGYVVGKPLGITAVSLLTSYLSGGRLQAPVGWLSIVGSGTLAGIPFTVSLLVAALAFDGTGLREAKFGILVAAVVSSLLSWAVFRSARLMPPARRVRALLGTAGASTDLVLPVDPARDHIRGPDDAPVTLVEYGDFECPYCGQAEPVVRELLAAWGDLRYVWRHLPLVDVHPRAKLAAIASEAAALQGSFWPMHDLLLEHQNELQPQYLVQYAGDLGLDLDQFRRDLQAHVGADRITEDIDSADLSGVSGTPTFFVNGRRHRGAYDLTTLTEAIKLAKAQTYLSR